MPIQRGSSSVHWRGDQVGSLARHDRVFKLRGKAKAHPCLGVSRRCTGRAKQWATIHGKSGLDPYCDYVPLCFECHCYYDRKSRIKRLTEQDVSEIKQLLREGVSRNEIKTRFPQGRTMIGRIARGQSWSDVP